MDALTEKLACQQQKLKNWRNWYVCQVILKPSIKGQRAAGRVSPSTSWFSRTKTTVSSIAKEQLSASIRIRLDFSILNDADYYSGLLFQGFIEEARETILYGGRYDRLMSRQGKEQGDRVWYEAQPCRAKGAD